MMNANSDDRLDLFDQRDIEVRFVDLPGGVPREVWFLEMQDPPSVDREAAIRALIDAVEEHLDHDGCCGVGSHTLDVKRAYTNWGASSAFETVVLTLSATILSGAAKHMWEMYKLEVLARPDSAHIDPQLDGLIYRAQWRVEAAYGVSAEDLHVLSEEVDRSARRATFRFQAPDGTTFEVDVSYEDGYAITGRVKREAPA
jgi:hypothetical protein